MTVGIHKNLIQGESEWLEARRGLLTASEMKLVLTPTLKIANNDKVRNHVKELAAQRISGYVEPLYISDDMLRGNIDEIEARELYSQHYDEVEEVGFITNDKFGFTLGYSPDGLVGDDGLIEVKSRRQKYQVDTIVENQVPKEYMLQIQTGLLVSERKWCDFISYSAGLDMITIRVEEDEEIQQAIIEASTEFHRNLKEYVDRYNKNISDKNVRLIPTERREYGDEITASEEIAA